MEWIDLSEPFPAPPQHTRRTLCESRIARELKNVLGTSSRSALLASVCGVFTPALLDTLCWFGTFAAGVLTGLWIAAVAGIVRLP
jgi:hypothetical protein